VFTNPNDSRDTLLHYLYIGIKIEKKSIEKSSKTTVTTVINPDESPIYQRLGRILQMLEKRIETAFVKATHQRGGLCLKFTSPSMAGVPDRLVLLPDGHMGFVEMKAPGKCPRPLQVQRLSQLKQLGYQVFVCDQFGQIGGMLDAIQTA
jgi:hypothetical protein